MPERDRPIPKTIHIDHPRCSGITQIELAAVLIVIVVIVAILLPPLGRPRGRGGTRLKDATQVRGIQTAMANWSADNRGLAPLPSNFDLDNCTVLEAGRAKDTTANIYSMLIWNQVVTPELLVSPFECGRVRVHMNYEYCLPGLAAQPEAALWDPAFTVALDQSTDSHASYAHLQPSDGRLDRWPDATGGGWLGGLDATPPPHISPLISMRGPEIGGVRANTDGSATLDLANPSSVTLLNGGREDRWDGNVAFADGSVRFISEPYLRGRVFGADRTPRPDVLFLDESDDQWGSNAFLGVFIEAGNARDEFKAVYD